MGVIRSKSTAFVEQVEKYGTASDAIFEMHGELTDLHARCVKAEKDAEELTDLAYRLVTGLIRARQNLFPNIDQTAVIHRDFPRIAAIAKEKQC